MVSYLEQRGQEGLQHYMTVDETGRLSRLFVEMEGACDEYALGGDDNVVLFDPTHGTSRYALKLCCFTTVSSAGQTIYHLGSGIPGEGGRLLLRVGFQVPHGCFQGITTRVLLGC